MFGEASTRVAELHASAQAFPVDAFDTRDDSLVAVVQDSVTAQVLWLGLIGADAPASIARSGMLCMPDVAQGRPLPVRHLSRSRYGTGIIILVEGTASRSQLDSMWPDASPVPPGPTESAELDQLFSAIRAEEKRLSGSKELRQVQQVEPVLVRDCAQRFVEAVQECATERVSQEAAALLHHVIRGLGSCGIPLGSVLEKLNQCSDTASGPVAETPSGRPPRLA